MRQSSKILERIKALNIPQRWSVVLLGSLLAMTVFVMTALHNGDSTPAFLLFYLPIGFSVILLSFNVSMVLTAIIAVVLIANHSITSTPTWVLLVFFIELIFKPIFIKKMGSQPRIRAFSKSKKSGCSGFRYERWADGL